MSLHRCREVTPIITLKSPFFNRETRKINKKINSDVQIKSKKKKVQLRKEGFRAYFPLLNIVWYKEMYSDSY